MKENTNITEVAHNEINRLESINAELLEALEAAQSAILRSKAFNVRDDFSLYVKMTEAIEKAKGN